MAKVLWLVLLCWACVLGQVASAQERALSPVLTTDSLQVDRCACRSFKWNFAVAPGLLLGSACVVRHFDNDLLKFREDHLFSFHNSADDVVQTLPGVVFLGLRAVGVKGKSETWGQLLAATGFSAAITAGLTEGLKNTWGRTRPNDEYFHNSFPSGHTFTAFTGATLLHREYGGKSIWYSVGGYTLAGLVGVSRILNKEHWASDVLAGAGLGLVSGHLGYGLAECMFAHPRRGRPSYYGRNPSFIGVNAHVSPWGNSINSLGVCTDPAATFEKQFVRFNHKIGYGYSLEGAYFPFRYVGFGCETSMFFNQFELDEDYFRVPANRVQAHYVAFESNKAKTYQFMPGIYFDVPVCSRVLVGGKVLYGMGQTLSFNVEADTHNPALGPEHWVYIYDDFTYGSAFKAGIHGRYLVGHYLEVSAGLNYSYSNAGYAFFRYPESTSSVQNLGFQLGVAVPLE